MRVLIVDDDAIVASSLATIVFAEDGIDVVGTCLSGAEAVRYYLAGSWGNPVGGHSGQSDSK